MTESLYTNWCMLNGCKPVPIAPNMAARFVADVAPLGIDKVWPAVQEISRLHYTIGLADPTLGYPVATLVSEIAKIEPPRSWAKQYKERFKTLPYDVQLYITEREKQRDSEVRRAQNKAAELIKEHNGPDKQAAAA
ncbi:hypothetical protein CO678_42010 [Bradyrhizobium diazoefficiens]|uniref:hypothetical protein n=1 Tax=Bradyrhizobium diazoefficiens TaxID=1355477 RepID=UPI000BEA685A|nr:hypothetical protein [Bradyrhizobium diazoefficiens]PDT55766.1 hypothetical protein CO678_42010 [Bradyrhizobium diazoefficiens]